MDVEPKIGVGKPPKWMVKIMEIIEIIIKMDDLGGPPLFLETPILYIFRNLSEAIKLGFSVIHQDFGCVMSRKHRWIMALLLNWPCRNQSLTFNVCKAGWNW